MTPKTSTSPTSAPILATASSEPVYTSAKFMFPFTLGDVDAWQLLIDDKRGVYLALSGVDPDSGGVGIQYVDNLAAVPCGPSTASFATTPWAPRSGAADFLDWLRHAAPTSVAIGAATPVVLGGLNGLQVEVFTSSLVPCSGLRLTKWQSDNAWVLLPDQQLIMTALDAPAATIVIFYSSNGVTNQVARVLATLQFRCVPAALPQSGCG